MNDQTILLAQASKKGLSDFRPLVILKDAITTEDIAPLSAKETGEKSPIGKYLLENKLPKSCLDSPDHAQENDHLLVRKTFSNSQLDNLMAPEARGGYTQYFGDAHVAVPDVPIESLNQAQATFIYDAAFAYQQSGRKLLVIAGENYGEGPSSLRAARGTALLGVSCIIAKSFSEKHRSQLIKQGILPLTFQNPDDYQKVARMHSCTFSFSDFPKPTESMQEIRLEASCGFTCVVSLQFKTISERDNYLSKVPLPYLRGCFLEE